MLVRAVKPRVLKPKAGNLTRGETTLMSLDYPGIQGLNAMIRAEARRRGIRLKSEPGIPSKMEIAWRHNHPEGSSRWA